jgi:prophage tail gpP-like protein
MVDGALIQGGNVLRMGAHLSLEGYSSIDVRGQASSLGAYIQQIQPQAFATVDMPMWKNRYKTIIAQGSITPLIAQLRAQWEVARQHAANMSVSVTVPGWHRPDGGIWDIRQLVFCYLPMIQVICTLMISKVTYVQNIARGTVTDLELADARVVKDLILAQDCNSGPMWNGIFDVIL